LCETVLLQRSFYAKPSLRLTLQGPAARGLEVDQSAIRLISAPALDARMTVSGQKLKSSMRVNVFRFAPEMR
jgi:hypothetical protein